ncbi:acetyl-CoA carboxylase biotin carboxyl carrier protein subunit [candidate division WOR-3 bacterium]|nr:acetyl-CoA carboxylase biotin carboxyl carrier protein subunit [candidate division WOR-3 bacterium]
MIEDKILLNIDETLYETCDFKRKSPGVSYEQNTKTEERAPIPGIIREIFVREGSTIKKGDPLYVVEAMKSYNKIISEYDGKVMSVAIKSGDKVKKGDIVIYRRDV